jgi:hypothetical protein
MTIYQLELTSMCNLKCGYCPHKALRRPKEHMGIETVRRTLDFPFLWNVVCGHHFGEPLLHPHILDIARLCREKGLGFGFSTNAELLTPEFFERLLDAGLTWLKISFHSPAGKTHYRRIKSLFPDFMLLTSDLEVKHDWAGQVGGGSLKRGRPSGDCVFHRYDLCAISAQGEILSCCMDAHGESAIGSLLDFTPGQFVSLENKIWTSLCDVCPMRRSDEELQNEYNEILGITRRAQAAPAHSRSAGRFIPGAGHDG